MHFKTLKATKSLHKTNILWFAGWHGCFILNAGWYHLNEKHICKNILIFPVDSSEKEGICKTILFWKEATGAAYAFLPMSTHCGAKYYLNIASGQRVWEQVENMYLS